MGALLLEIESKKMNDTPKKRGRPPKPKEPKAPAKMGRPSVWSPENGPLKKSSPRLPEKFWVSLKKTEFRKKLDKLLLDFD